MSLAALAITFLAVWLGAAGSLALRDLVTGPAQQPLRIEDGNALQHGCIRFVGDEPRFRWSSGAGGGLECKGAPATGIYMDGTLSRGGWYQLSITTSAAFTDEQQALTLGYLEGWLTAEQIYAHHHNMQAYFNLSSQAPLEWLEQQDDWTRQQAAIHDGPFWSAMRLLHAQMDGMPATLLGCSMSAINRNRCTLMNLRGSGSTLTALTQQGRVAT